MKLSEKVRRGVEGDAEALRISPEVAGGPAVGFGAGGVTVGLQRVHHSIKLDVDAAK